MVKLHSIQRGLYFLYFLEIRDKRVGKNAFENNTVSYTGESLWNVSKSHMDLLYWLCHNKKNVTCASVRCISLLGSLRPRSASTSVTEPLRSVKETVFIISSESVILPRPPVLASWKKYHNREFHTPYFFGYNTGFIPPKQPWKSMSIGFSSKTIPPKVSYKKDLEFWECFGRNEPIS